MTKKKWFALLIVLGLIGLRLSGMIFSEEKSTGNQTVDLTANSSREESAAVENAEESSASVNSDGNEAEDSRREEKSNQPAHAFTVSELAPRAVQVRAEVKKDPHSTPVSILAFAAELSERLDTVLNKPENADVFFRELEECVKATPDLGTSVRAICLSNAKELATVVPAFNDHYQNLLKTAPVDVVRLLQ